MINLKLTKPIVFVFILFSMIVSAESKLIVVSDQSNSSALPYYQMLNIQNDKRPIKPVPAVILPVDETSTLPIKSHKLTPGIFEPRIINANGLIRPFFLVGTDKLSMNWLKQRYSLLKQLKAVGLVVSVADKQSLSALRALAPDLMLLPVSGDDIAERLDLIHYPVLITATGIDQ